MFERLAFPTFLTLQPELAKFMDRWPQPYGLLECEHA